MLARWLQELNNYDFDSVHRSGKKHSNADGLSRIVIDGECDCYIAGKDETTLPCGVCEVCTRMQAQWRRFEEDVDDVVPLAYGMIVPGQGTTTASVGVQVPGEETWGDGCRLLEPGPIEEQGDSLPVTQEMECGGEHDDDLLVRQIGLNGDPQPDQENEASPMGVESNFMSQYSLEVLKELQKAGCWFGTADTMVSSRCDAHGSGSDVAEFQYKTHAVVSGAVEIATRSPVLRMGSWAVEKFAVGDTRLTQRQGDSAVPWHNVRRAPRSWEDNGEDKTEGILVWNVNWCASLCCNLQAVHSEQEISTDYACSFTKLSSRESWWSGAFGHAGAILRVIRGTNMYWWLLISSLNGWKWFLYQCKMRSLLPRHFSNTTSFVLECLGVCTRIKEGTLIANCSRPSVNCLMPWRHGPLRIDPVQMLNATISWCWTFCGVS